MLGKSETTFTRQGATGRGKAQGAIGHAHKSKWVDVSPSSPGDSPLAWRLLQIHRKPSALRLMSSWASGFWITDLMELQGVHSLLVSASRTWMPHTKCQILAPPVYWLESYQGEPGRGLNFSCGGLQDVALLWTRNHRGSILADRFKVKIIRFWKMKWDLDVWGGKFQWCCCVWRNRIHKYRLTLAYCLQSRPRPFLSLSLNPTSLEASERVVPMWGMMSSFLPDLETGSLSCRSWLQLSAIVIWIEWYILFAGDPAS